MRRLRDVLRSASHRIVLLMIVGVVIPGLWLGGLGLNSILAGNTNSFLDLAQRPRLLQTTQIENQFVGGFKKAGETLGGIGSILG